MQRSYDMLRGTQLAIVLKATLTERSFPACPVFVVQNGSIRARSQIIRTLFATASYC